MPVRSRLQERKQQEAARERFWATRLAAHKPAESTTTDPGGMARRLATIHRPYVFRTPETFHRRIRSKDEGRIRLLTAEHVFGRFPAARHLRSIWLQTPAAQPSPTDAFRTRVYLEAVSGGSVHKTCTAGFMTKKETHRFLTVGHTDSFIEALWYALACSHTDEQGLARRLSVSRIAQQDWNDPFWREALRFFCVNPAPLARVNDLTDFLTAEHRRNRDYSLRGRTLGSLCEQAEQWHRALARAKRMGDAKWDGFDLPDAQYDNVPTPKGRRFDWRFSQIKCSQDLAEEGTTMHHCVYSYQRLCTDGVSSIWSLKIRPGAASDGTRWTRALTIELRTSDRRLVQIRGYANRQATTDERAIVTRWASEHGLAVNRWD